MGQLCKNYDAGLLMFMMRFTIITMVARDFVKANPFEKTQTFLNLFTRFDILVHPVRWMREQRIGKRYINN